MNDGRTLPNEILHDEFNEMTVVKGVNDVRVITQKEEIATLISLLETDRWEQNNLGVKCMPDYTLVFNAEIMVGLMCINEEVGYSRIEYQGQNYYYSMPMDNFGKIVSFLEDLYK